MNAQAFGVATLIANGSLFAMTSIGTAPVRFSDPTASISQRTSTAAAFVTDSGAMSIMDLNRAGRWAEAERAGLTFLSNGIKDRPIFASNCPGNAVVVRNACNSLGSTQRGEWCAVLIGVTFAQVRLHKSREAALSMSSFDATCRDAVFADFFPRESDRVRRLVNGEPVNEVYKVGYSSIVNHTGGATDAMLLNRESRYEEVERVAHAFLAKHGVGSGDPEACAVLISLTYAQAKHGRTTEAKNSLAAFDRQCKGVRYLDWFPAETERVRRVVNAESAKKLH